MPPPRSSTPRKPNCEEELELVFIEVFLAMLPEALVKAVSNTPQMVTEDWAIAAPEAAKTAKATRVFFI